MRKIFTLNFVVRTNINVPQKVKLNSRPSQKKDLGDARSRGWIKGSSIRHPGVAQDRASFEQRTSSVIFFFSRLTLRQEKKSVVYAHCLGKILREHGIFSNTPDM